MINNNQKTLLVLGAGLDQVFMIKTAKNLGLNVIAVDGNKDAPGFSFCDYFEVISTRNSEEIIAFAKKFIKTTIRIDGVSTMGSDIPHIVARVSSHLGLPSITLKSADLAVNKYLMKKAFNKFGINTPPFRLINTLTELKSVFEEFESKIVIKPLDQAGSRGVSLISSKEMLEPYLYHAKKNTSLDSILVEKFLEGPQISSESIVINGEVYTPGFADRNYDEIDKFLPQIMENGGWVPSIFEYRREEISKVIKTVADCMGIKNGVIKGDIVIYNKEVFIIEVAARLSGGDFSESLVPIGANINYVESVIQQSIGAKVEYKNLDGIYNSVVANRYFFAKKGLLQSVDGIDEVISKNWIKKFQLWFQPGDVLPDISNHGQRTGVFVISGNSREQVQDRINWVYNTIKFNIKE